MHKPEYFLSSRYAVSYWPTTLNLGLQASSQPSWGHSSSTATEAGPVTKYIN